MGKSKQNRIGKQKLLVFHPVIAPYRIDFFNKLNESFDAQICLFMRQMVSQKFNYQLTIESRFKFSPCYLEKTLLGLRRGVFSSIRKFKPDIVLVSECGIASLLVVLYKILLRKHFRIVSIIDDSYHMIIDGNHFSKRHAIAEKILIPLFDNIITVEPRVCEYFQGRYGKGIFFPIISDPNLSRNRYEAALPCSERYIEKYELLGKKVLLFVGRLAELKNLQFVIPVFKSIINEDYRFIIVGSGKCENELKSLAEGDSRVVFIGRQEGEALYAWYNVACCFILPSYKEPFGAVTNEALLAGSWSIVSEYAGSQCLIVDGVNGFVINPYETESVRDKIILSMEKTSAINLPLSMKPDLMTYDFEKMMDNLISQIS